MAFGGLMLLTEGNVFWGRAGVLLPPQTRNVGGRFLRGREEDQKSWPRQRAKPCGAGRNGGRGAGATSDPAAEGGRTRASDREADLAAGRPECRPRGVCRAMEGKAPAGCGLWRWGRPWEEELGKGQRLFTPCWAAIPRPLPRGRGCGQHSLKATVDWPGGKLGGGGVGQGVARISPARQALQAQRLD